MPVLINGRDEPRVVFDVGPLFEGACLSNSACFLYSLTTSLANTFAQALTLTDPTPFTLSPPRARTGAFFAQPEGKDVCRPARGVGVGGMCHVSFCGFSLSLSNCFLFLLSVPLVVFIYTGARPLSG
jgi:hypothetical protein